MKLLITIFLFLINVAISPAQNLRFFDIKTISNYQNALQKSIEEDKMLFVVVYEDGDDFYTMQKDDLFTNAVLSSAYSKTVPIAVDIYSDMGARLAGIFKIDNLPTFFYLTNEEALVYSTKGYLSINQLLSALEQAQKNTETYATLKTKYANKTLTNSEWVQLLHFQALNFSFDETRILANQFFVSLSDAQLVSEEILPVSSAYALDLETKYPKILLQNADSFTSKAEYLTYYQNVYSFNFDRAVDNKDSTLLEKIVVELIPFNPETTTSQTVLQFETQKVYASETYDLDVWKRAAFSRIDKLDSDSLKAAFLFDEAYEIAEDFNTEDGNKVCRLMMEKANSLNPQYSYKMLEGYMAYLLKDYTEAKVLVEEAKALSDNANNQRKANGLLKLIAKDYEKSKSD